MKPIFAHILFWIACTQSPLFGDSVFIPVTPEGLKQSNFVFKFDGHQNAKGAQFSLEAILTNDTLSTFNGCLGIVKITPNTSEIKGVRSIPINIKGNIYNAHFFVATNLLNAKDLHFIFAEYVRVMMNGKIVPMPSVTFYTFHLKDFLPK